MTNNTTLVCRRNFLKLHLVSTISPQTQKPKPPMMMRKEIVRETTGSVA